MLDSRYRMLDVRHKMQPRKTRRKRIKDLPVSTPHSGVSVTVQNTYPLLKSPHPGVHSTDIFCADQGIEIGLTREFFKNKQPVMYFFYFTGIRCS